MDASRQGLQADSDVKPVYVRLKEIAAKRIGDPQEEFGVKTLTIEYLVYIGPVTSECISQPYSSLLLTSEFIPDEFSYEWY